MRFGDLSPSASYKRTTVPPKMAETAKRHLADGWEFVNNTKTSVRLQKGSLYWYKSVTIWRDGETGYLDCNLTSMPPVDCNAAKKIAVNLGISPKVFDEFLEQVNKLWLEG